MSFTSRSNFLQMRRKTTKSRFEDSSSEQSKGSFMKKQETNETPSSDNGSDISFDSSDNAAQRLVELEEIHEFLVNPIDKVFPKDGEIFDERS